MIAAEVAVILAVAVLVAAFAPTPLVAVLICVTAIAVLYGSPHLVAAVVAWWQRRAAVSEQRIADAIEKKAAPGRFAAGLDPTVVGRTFVTGARRTHVDAPVVRQAIAQIEREVLGSVLASTQRTGRHRRPDGDLPADAVSATDNLRRVDAAAAERHRLMLAAVEADQHPAGR